MLLASVTLTYILGIVLIKPHSRLMHAWADSGWPLMHTWVAVECFGARGKQRFHRFAYYTLVAENVISVVALVYWAYAELVWGVASPFPTPADFAFLEYTPVYALGIFILAGGTRNRSLSPRHLGDVGISIATMLFVGMLIYYEPSVESRLSTKALGVALAYPVLSCSSTAVGLLALLRQPTGGLHRVIAIHFWALTMHATAYTLYGVAIMTHRYEVGHALDPLWFGGLALTVWAAREDRWLSAHVPLPRPAMAPSMLDAVIPVVACAILALAIGAFRDQLPRVPPHVLVTASLLFVGSLGVRGIAVMRLERDLRRQNLGLLEIERAARTAAETLANASALLTESLECDRVLGNVARLVVKAMPGWCVIDLVDGDRVRRAAVEHIDPEKRALLKALGSRCPPNWNDLTGQAIRLGRPVTLTADILRSWCEDDDERLDLLRTLGTDSGIAAPLIARGRTLGAMAVASSSHRFRTIERQLFVELAQRAAIAIDNAELYRESQEALRSREEFIQVASHELKTPVTALLLNLESAVSRLRRGPVRAEDMLRLAAQAERQGRNVARLVNDLTDFTQLERDRVALQTRPVELTGLIRNLLERSRPKLDRASCQLSVDLGPPITGSWDPLRVEQVVQKLLANAAKFGTGKPVEVRVESVGNLARLSIVDHGIGIDPSTQGRLFAPFARGVSADHYGGLGLGLYVCRRVVEAHGGSIRVESQPGCGAKFIVELPTQARTEHDLLSTQSPMPLARSSPGVAMGHG